ncbi:hypothetical protein PhCBS80983_g05465 [Powellomyces hirtus]|uniref:P-loop containing nucleoside triphosphate hydrolase protein n=1 Tax=Powellomyces hirtus TaxID=109895 RepID=A0A507DU28_9FUNG|nr:hypothetical protein PhCBS80983_g05465 [Powellomyces hirtus]
MAPPLVALVGALRLVNGHKSTSTRQLASPWLAVKLLMTLAFLAVMLSQWLLSASEDLFSFRKAHVTYALNVASVSVIVLISVYHQRRGSGVAGSAVAFWFTSLAVNLLRIQTIMMYPENRRLRTLVVIGAVLNLIAFVMEGRPLPEHPDQNKLLLDDTDNSSLNRSILSRVFFVWLVPVMRLGRQKSLTMEDLPALETEFRAHHLAQRFQDASNKLTTPKSNPPSLARILVGAFGFEYAMTAVVRLLWVAATAAIPQVNNALLTVIARGSSSQNPIASSNGYWIAVTLLVLSLFRTVCHAHFNQSNQVVGIKARTAVIDAIYAKVFRIANLSEKEQLNVNNLVSMDAMRLTTAATTLHYTWSIPIEMAVFFAFLYKMWGVSTLIILPVIVAVVFVIIWLGVRQMSFEAATMGASDKRIKFITELITGVKTIKLYAWERFARTKIMQHRADELSAILKSRLNMTYQIVLTTALQPLMVLALLLVYSGVEPETLVTAQAVFTSLNYFKYMCEGLEILTTMSGELSGTFVSYGRLNRFLEYRNRDVSHIQQAVDSKTSVAINIKNATFHFPREAARDGGQDVPSATGVNVERPNLVIPNLVIPRNKLVAVVGPTGSGKSTLLKAILGQVDCSSGTVEINGSMAYAAQDPWIYNGTIEENICSMFPNADPSRYSKCIAACALGADLEILAEGDRTEIGARGVNISGGQRQRISLARVAYSNASIILCDDSLSAVDGHTNTHIFTHLLGPGGLLCHQTRILITHSIQHLPQVDYVIVMNAGHIVEQGSYDDLVAARGPLHDMMVSGGVSLEKTVAMPIETFGPDERDVTKDEDIKTLAEAAFVDQDNKVASAVKSTAENSETGHVKWAVFASYANSLSIGGLVIALFLAIGMVAMQVGGQFWLDQWTQDVSIGISHSRWFYPGIYAVFAVATILFDGASGYFIMGVLGVRSSRHLMQKVVNALLKCPMQFFEATPMGQIVNRFAGDFMGIDHILPSMTYMWLMAVLLTLGVVVTCSIVTPLMLVLFVVLSIGSYYIRMFYINSSVALKRLDASTKSPIFASFSETLEGVATIKAFGVIDMYREANRNKLDLNIRAYYYNISVLRWLILFLDMLGSGLTLFGAALFGVIARDSLSVGALGVSINMALQMSMHLQILVRGSCDFETQIVAVERVNQYADLPAEPQAIGGSPPDKDWPTKGEIIFDHANVRYRKNLPLVLKDVSFTIRGGEKIGIVGRTGAGKSSIMVALFNLVIPETGRILIDGHDLKDVDPQTLREALTAIPQDAHLFSGTLRENLIGPGSYDDGVIWQALDDAGLKASVSSMDGKLDALVTAGGENFSSGERQLLTLARALIRGGRIFVLDESTANVDRETERQIRIALTRRFASATVLTIAHRIDTIMDSDRVLLLNQGTVQQYDTVANLVNNEQSAFYLLAQEAGALNSSARGVCSRGSTDSEI